MRTPRFLIYASVLLSCLAQIATAQDPVFFKGVRLFDGERTTQATNVLIMNGTIEAVGNAANPVDDCKQVDGTGKTLLPGLIDCHTHSFTEGHLQQAAEFGVTTELDMMSIPYFATYLRRQQQLGKAANRADFLSAGAAVTMKGGHGTQFGFPVPTVEMASDVPAFVAKRVQEGSDYIKLIVEDGSAYGISFPTLDEEMIRAAIKAAHEHEKLAVSHVSTESGARRVLGAGVDGLVHLFCDLEISDETLQQFKSNDVFVVPTAAVASNASGSPQVDMILNDDVLSTVLTNDDLVNLKRKYPVRPGATGSWETLKLNISRLHRSGVPILAGTDAPNPGTVHGISMHHELRLLVEAGLSCEEALAAATSLPAKYFRLENRGRIEPGRRADLLLVEGDPTSDIEDTARIVDVWKAGHQLDRPDRQDETRLPE